MQKLSFVIPCYRSDETLRQVVEEIADTVATRPEYDYEVILVNDNPPDATWDLIQEIHRENPRVHGVCMAKNFGQHSALMAGYRHVTGDLVISLDDDGQNPPREMFRLIDAVTPEVDVVHAIYPTKQHSLFRNFGSKVNDWMTCWLLNKPKGLYLASYFLAKRFVIDEVCRYQGPFPYVDGLVLRSTARMINVEVDHQPRQSGSSGYTLGKLLALWMNGFTAFSVKPLRLSTLAGMAFSAFGFIMAVILVVQKILLGSNIDAGWSSVMCLLLIIGGLMLAALGVAGEYIGRIYLSQCQTPQYVVKYETKEGVYARSELSK